MVSPYASVFVEEMTLDINSLVSAGIFPYQRQRAALFCVWGHVNDALVRSTHHLGHIGICRDIWANKALIV